MDGVGEGIRQIYKEASSSAYNGFFFGFWGQDVACSPKRGAANGTAEYGPKRNGARQAPVSEKRHDNWNIARSLI